MYDSDADYRPRRVGVRYGNPTKPLTRKTFHVIIRGCSSEQVLMAFWRHFGNHPDRLDTGTSKVVTGAEVRDGDLHLAVDYTVRGGHPSDLRKWIGRLLYGEPTRGDNVEAIHKETVRLEG